ncbi:MAG: iron uptake porin [Leptolyngbya sp. Prado105]|nr:iron uptake porin [Leptolyngbya sp. Prado105]
MKLHLLTCAVTVSSLFISAASVRAAETSTSRVEESLTVPTAETTQTSEQLAQAAPIVPANPQGENIGQVTSVSQLSDVRPTDWAFQALQSLVERYGCIAGYPERTYRGNRALTRYEFAAGLNACLDRVNELIAASTADLVKKEDLATLQRLQQEFAIELATLRGRVDALEARTGTLERQQFSTTTKLQGNVLLGAINVLAGDRPDGTSAKDNLTLGYRVELNLNTSFTGRDLLTTRLQANNLVPRGGTAADATSPTGVVGLGSLGTNMGRIEFEGNSESRVRVSLLRYRFPLGNNTDIFLAGTGNGFVDLDASAQLNPFFDGGAVSLFALRNPIYNYSGGAGIGVRHRIGTAAEVNLGYLVPNASIPEDRNGLFNGQYGALAQVIFNLSPTSRVGLTYINAYVPSPGANPDPTVPFALSATGSNLSNSAFGSPVNINAYGINASFQLSPKFAIGGWVGYANHNYIGRGRGDVWNWAVTLAFPDLFKDGNLGGLFIGQEPKLTRSDLGFRDRGSSLHLEAFYRYRVSDNIAITPGVIWVTNPDFDENNRDAVIGVIRTLFTF